MPVRRSTSVVTTDRPRSAHSQGLSRRALVLMASALVLLSLPVPAGAVLPGTNGRIVFTSGRDGPADDSQARLFLLPVTTSLAGRIVSAPIVPPGGQYRHPTWSPDRTRIAYANGTPGAATTENYDIFIQDLTTGAITPITDTGDSLSADHPAWSPDGTRIAYEHQPTDNSAERDIRVQTVGTAAPAAALTSGAPVEFKPAWSPDSQTIYYAKVTALPNPNLDIVREPATGGSVTPVLAGSGVDEYQPSISPDGSQICFTLQIPPGNTGTAEIYTAALPSPGFLANISDDPTKGDINCTWSPDGRKIAYVSGTFSAGALVMESADDSDVIRTALTDVAGRFDGNPDWAPDGRPDCPDATVTTRVNTPVTIPLECVDTGPVYERSAVRETVANDGGPRHGTVTFPGPPGDPSLVIYTPNQNFIGTDTIESIGFDEFGFGTDQGTITIDVQPDPGAPPPPPGGGGTSPAGGGAGPDAPPFAAKLEVERARVLRAGRELDVLAPITARASGSLDVRFRAAGRTERFDAQIDAGNRRARFRRGIPAAQATLGTGILTLTYPGDADTQPQEVRLRAASRRAGLEAGRPRIQDGRLQATGEISGRARGVVRLQLLFEPPGQDTRTLLFQARITNGRYRFDEPLTGDQRQQIAQRRGVVHSYTLFTGHFERRIRGEMQSHQVLPAR